jgi:hypothetical protein
MGNKDFEITIDEMMASRLSKRGVLFRQLFQKLSCGVGKEFEEDSPKEIELENKAHASNLEWLRDR